MWALKSSRVRDLRFKRRFSACRSFCWCFKALGFGRNKNVVVRTLTGHRSNCTALEFHPFGEFFVSGSMDTNVMIWDIRKKGCIHTYKGHTRGISTIRFSPDGRWVVSGGLDNVVKIWDLTAGKLLHDFKFHDGHIRSIDFHPLEFLLATGSADRTVKFWDLETFELIGSARPQASGVRSINFHPDGRTLFCGFDDSLKVYSWEPMICHDAVEMGWSTLGDLCIHDGKLLGSSYYQNYVGVWVVDISLIEPYGAGFVPEQNHHLRESKYNLLESPIEKVGGHTRSTSTLRSMSPEYESRDIKTIYVDSEKPVVSRKIGSLKSPKVVLSSDSKNVKKFPSQKQVPEVGMQAKTIGKTNTKSFAMPSVVPRESLDGKDSANSKSLSTGIPRKPLHVRSSSASQLDMERLPMAIELGPFVNMKTAMSPNFRDRVVAGEDARESSEEKQSNIKSVAENFEKVLSPRTPSNVDNGTETLDGSKGINSVKYVNGVAVVQGRTRTLVERFERRDKVNSDEVQTPDTAVRMISETAKASPFQDIHPQISGRESTSNDENVLEDLMQNHDALLSTFRSRLTKLQVVRHFWERNDIMGALNSMRKLPDHSVQADVVTVLMDKMEIFTLDLFSCLLPVLLSLLDSKIERHAHISLEMLLKLVAVFGPVVRSNISSPSAVGVDLQAEQRLECCNQCFIELEKIKTILPALARRGGLIAKFARELNLVLQES